MTLVPQPFVGFSGMEQTVTDENGNAVKIGNSTRCCKLQRCPATLATNRPGGREGSQTWSKSEDLPEQMFIRLSG